MMVCALITKTNVRKSVFEQTTLWNNTTDVLSKVEMPKIVILASILIFLKEEH